MEAPQPPDKCQHCKGKKVRCMEKTSNQHLNVWLCPDCDGRALNFAKISPES